MVVLVASEPLDELVCDGMVLIMDDDPSVRAGLVRLLTSVGFEAHAFDSVSDLLAHDYDTKPSCLLLDVRLRGVNGLDVQAALRKAGIGVPVVMMTGYGNIPMSVQAMRAGAVDFLTKPFSEEQMLAAVRMSIEQDRQRIEAQHARRALKDLYQSLTAREREIMALVCAGLLNKQVAGVVGLSEISVKVHRRNVMTKMQADSLADLVRMAETLGVPRPTGAAIPTVRRRGSA